MAERQGMESSVERALAHRCRKVPAKRYNPYGSQPAIFWSETHEREERAMGRANTIFEQVPIDIVRKIAIRDAGHWITDLASCAICGRAVELECCKTDEHGEAVHEKCYAARMAPGMNGKRGHH
jgi:hypothetical protein